jgi:hypothetical protein
MESNEGYPHGSSMDQAFWNAWNWEDTLSFHICYSSIFLFHCNLDSNLETELCKDNQITCKQLPWTTQNSQFHFLFLSIKLVKILKEGNGKLLYIFIPLSIRQGPWESLVPPDSSKKSPPSRMMMRLSWM